MSGVLEKLQADMAELLANQATMLSQVDSLTRALGKTPTVTQALPAPSVGEQGTTTNAPATEDVTAVDHVTGELELDSDGVPWDARIHSDPAKRTKGGQGTWQKKRGLDKNSPGLYDQVMAELKATYADSSASNDAPPPPAASTGTPPPAAAAAPASDTPPPPAAPAVPAATDPAEAARKAAVEATTELTKERGAILDVVEQYINETYGVDNFSMLPADKYEQYSQDVKDWSARLQTAQGTVNAIRRIYESDPSVIEPAITQLVGRFQYISAGQAETALSVEQVPYSQLSTLNQTLNDYLAQCKKAAGQ